MERMIRRSREDAKKNKQIQNSEGQAVASENYLNGWGICFFLLGQQGMGWNTLATDRAQWLPESQTWLGKRPNPMTSLAAF